MIVILWKWETSLLRVSGIKMRLEAGFLQTIDFLPSTVCTKSCQVEWWNEKDSMTWGWVPEAEAGQSAEILTLRNSPSEWCPVSREFSCQCRPLRFTIVEWTGAFMNGWGEVFTRKWACNKFSARQSFPPHWESAANCKSLRWKWSGK